MNTDKQQRVGQEIIPRHLNISGGCSFCLTGRKTNNKKKTYFFILFLNVRFILDSLKKEYYKGTKYPATFDHWRPQHKLCPFCLINFRWEEMKTNFVPSSFIFDHFPMQNIFPAWRKWWRRALLLHQSWPWLRLWACEGECAGREGEGCQYGHDTWEVNIFSS